jgi:hypothetical protein
VRNVKPSIQLMLVIIREAILFLEDLEKLEEADFRQASLISDKRDVWSLKFSAFYKDEDFARELILHVSIPDIDIKLVSDEKIR